MSRINDALKQARQSQPRSAANLTPQHIAANEDRTSPLVWIIPSVIIFLIIAAIFFISWATAHHTMNSIVGDTDWPTNHVSAASSVPTVKPTTPAPAPPPPVTVAEDLPVLQGIFYSTTAPTAIVDNKNVSPGDQLRQYRVKEITKYSVILTGPDGKDIKLGVNDVH